MKLSILIGTRNRFEILQKCLGALLGKIEVEHQVIVVDAGSTDGTLTYLAGLSGIRLVCDGKPIGQAQSFNRIFRTLQSEYVCWLSDDNVVLDGMLDTAVAILEKNPDIGLVTLKTKDVTGLYSDLPYIGGIWSPPGILNCNQGMLPTELLQQIGGFDEEFRDYGIDADLTTKVLLAGYKVVYTKRIAIHHYRDHETISWIDSEGRKQRMQAARELYKRKYAPLFQLGGESRDSKYSRRDRSEFGRIRWMPQLVSESKLLAYWMSWLLYFATEFQAITSRLGHKVLSWGEALYSRIYQVGMCQLLGYSDRDLYNVSACRFISNWDLLVNCNKPYYLVQQLPEKLRREFHRRANSRQSCGSVEEIVNSSGPRQAVR